MVYCNTALNMSVDPKNPKINCIEAYNRKQVSFKGIPVYDFYLKKLGSNGEYKLVPATFLKLEPENKQDIQALKEIGERWKDTDFGRIISADFCSTKIKDKMEYYAVVLKETLQSTVDNLQSLGKKILCIVSVKQEGNRLSPYQLQASPDIINTSPRKIKRVGEGSFSNIVKLAQDRGVDGIQIYSSNDRFYNDLADFELLERDDYADVSTLYLDKSKFQPLLDRVKKEYSPDSTPPS
jgi:hypothetical protein